MQRIILTSTAIGFFVLQIILFIAAQFQESKHFCWAPHNTQVKYQLQCFVNDTALNDTQILKRYGLYASGWEAHSQQNIKDLIIAAERQNITHEKVNVIYKYSVNSNQEITWVYNEKN